MLCHKCWEPKSDQGQSHWRDPLSWLKSPHWQCLHGTDIRLTRFREMICPQAEELSFVNLGLVANCSTIVVVNLKCFAAGRVPLHWFAEQTTGAHKQL